MITLLFGLLFFWLQPTWAASQYVWHSTIGSDVKIASDEQAQLSAGDWTCALTKNVGYDKKEIRQLECVLDEEKTQLTVVCGDFATYDMANVALPQKKGGRITVGLSCSTKPTTRLGN